ncbi:coiled-coil domain-containing protein 150 isoform X2 [Lates calcarifer]|uniref:Coiled-coil domain-containing protein 150 isoform X2 n=1 Tax=Lates calcarifer TaxID=8187 RepID=A0AAJ7PVA4_LATCA|nr:coiled-coil domain-containing protein 150 isoform X2 [Lates calcarifer]
MSCSATLPLSARATAPEALCLLHQRLLLAEEEAEGLIRDMGALGVSRDQILGSGKTMDTTQSPLTMQWFQGDENTLWQQWDSVGNRVCRMESLLQTLKLTIFCLETERELDPSHTARLKQQLAELQQESEEEQQACRREVMKLRDQLQQAYQERDEAHTEVQRLRETVEAATAAKMDVALAAEELKIVKSEMSQKIMEMREQMRQESTCSAEAMKSHSKLLQCVEEMERVVKMERRQRLQLQSECQVLCVEAQTSRQQLEEEKDRGRHLEEYCRQLKEQTAVKDSLVFELKTELKRQQTENNKLQKEGREMRAAADILQAEKSRVVKQLQEQDRLLKAARCNIQTELKVALTDKVNLQRELEKLKEEHAHLYQSSSIAQEMAGTQKEILERTIERQQRELSTAHKEEEAIRKDLENSKQMLCSVVTKLEGEKSSLETHLSEAKEVGSLSSALQSQQDENRRLMRKVTALEQQMQADQMLKDLTERDKTAYGIGKLKMSELEALQHVCGPARDVVSQTLESILASHTRLQVNSQTLHQELGGREQELTTLKKDRLQAQTEIRNHQVEVEKLQQLLTSTHSKNNRALESLQKALDTVKVDNKRLAQSLKQAVLTNSSLHRKLEQSRNQYQAIISLRDVELYEAQTKINHLSEELSAVKQQRREDYESSMKMLHREISELKMTVKDSSTRSGDLSKANQGLRRRVSELERLVSKQKACIREQRSHLREQWRSRGLQDNSQKMEPFLLSSETPEKVGSMFEARTEVRGEHQEVRTTSKQDLSKWEAEERWTSTIQRWEAKRELAHITEGYKPVRTQLKTH